jgi:hypothetical protein
MTPQSCRCASSAWCLGGLTLVPCSTAGQHKESVCCLLRCQPVMQVTLHRSDTLTALVDIDAHLKISRADDAVGLMFGVSAKSLVNKSLARWVQASYAGFCSSGIPKCQKHASTQHTGSLSACRCPMQHDALTHLFLAHCMQAAGPVWRVAV